MSDPLEKALEVIREYHKNLRDAQADADRRRELLKRVQWEGCDASAWPQCPICHADIDYRKHEPDCELAKELE